jgi:hypothetical protein
MKTVLLLICAVATFATAQAQVLRLAPDSLRQVQAQARQQQKPLLVLVAPPPPPTNLPKAMQKSRTQSGLNEPEVVKALNQDFLVKEIRFNSHEGAPLVRQYTITSYPTYLYFAPDGTLLYRRFGNASSSAPYLKDIAAARQALADPHNLSYYQAEYERGNRDADFLRQYLVKRQQLGQVVESDLLDSYADQLPAKAFDRAADVQFILELGPVVGSRAFRLSHLNGKLIDSLYRVLPLAQRQAMNNRMIGRTMSQAIATRNQNMAQEGANFARSTWTNNPLRGARVYESNMLDFYRLTKDTTNYLRQSSWFYERYYMNISTDSARKALAANEAQQKEQAASRQRLLANGGRPPGLAPGSPTMVATTIRRGGPAPDFVNELNTGAWNVYLTGTHNRDYLSRAVQWSKRTVDLTPRAAYYDTLAHLLYRLRFFAEAEAMQQQAIAHAAPEGMSSKQFEQELTKMRKHQPL